MSVKSLFSKYKTARNAPDALRLGVDFRFGLKLFRKNDPDESKWQASTDADTFSIPVIDIASVLAVLTSAVLIYELVTEFIDLIRYKKRF